MFGRKVVPITVATLACAVLLACGGERAPGVALTAPGAAASSRDEDSHKADKPEHAFQGTTCKSNRLANGSGVFGPGGGTLVFGTSRLIIPGGALRDTVTISATIPEGNTNRVEFRPTGLRFAKAAGLLLDTSGCDISNPAPNVVYLSESGEVLETIIAVYDPHWHTIAAPIWHFSGYAIAF